MIMSVQALGNTLTENETKRVWENMLEAEVRSFYFGELASRYTTYKQVITGISFFLSSGAAAAIIAKAPAWVPVLSASIVAILTAYSMAVGLDRRASAMSKLHYEWNHLTADYERLWNHWHEDNASEVFEDLLRRGREASEAGTEMPYDEKLIAKWEKHVYSRFQQQTPALRESHGS